MKLLISFVLLIPTLSIAGLNIKTTLPELNWLVSEILGDKGESKSLLSGYEDPHFVDVTPAFIFKVKGIDLLVKNGLALESTWLPKIIELSGNANFDKDGLCDASSEVSVLGKMKEVDRSLGDVHPEGNPHYTYSPLQMINASLAIKNCLIKVDKKHSSYYEKNFKELKAKLEALHKSVKARLALYKNVSVMTYHKEFSYFCNDYNLNCIDTVEETPGVLPSASHLFKKYKTAKSKSVKMVLATRANSNKILKKFQEISGIKYYQIESHMNDKVKTYENHIEQLVSIFEKHGK